MAEAQPIPWPPPHGPAFLRSEAFGRLLVSLAGQLAQSYPAMDFTDAVAHVFAWFDQKLAKNRRFINPRRFPTVKAFNAYVRQSLWNAARLAERQRQRREQVVALPGDQQIVAFPTSPEELDRMLDLVEKLPEPHKTVFHKVFFDEEDLAMIASMLDRSEEEINHLYEESVDMLAKLLTS